MEQHQATGLAQQPSTTTTIPTTDGTPLPNQPSYTEMITAAILWDSSQGKAGGSSKRSIAKYIDRVYSSNLPPSHSALLTHHLKRLKNSGQLVMIKNSYQLPILAATVNTTPSGIASAPPLQAQPLQSTASANVAGSVELNSSKKRPGRPPKNPAQARPGPDGKVEDGSSAKKPRGRPPKSNAVAAHVPFGEARVGPEPGGLGLVNGPGSVKRSPGRPPKKQSTGPGSPMDLSGGPVGLSNLKPTTYVIEPVNGTTVQKKRPGRPPKSASPSSGPSSAPVSDVQVGGEGLKLKGRGRGRPKRSAMGIAAKPIGKKMRGRPPRVPGAVPVAPVSGGKRRGRPPKGSVSVGAKLAKPVGMYTGKPRGRPKGTSTLKQRKANEELLKKVENMQSKVRDAVGVLKPYINNENATDALTALQQLEAISAMDITAPSVNPPMEQPVTLQETVVEPAAQESTIPAPEASPLPPVMTDTAHQMTDTAPFYMPPNFGTQQPTSWIPSGEAHM